jgi:hypothetical protein
MKERAESPNQSGIKVRFRNLVLKEWLEELQWKTPSILDGFPEVAFVGSGRPERSAKDSP